MHVEHDLQGLILRHTHVYMYVCNICVTGMVRDFSGHTEVTLYPESTILL